MLGVSRPCFRVQLAVKWLHMVSYTGYTLYSGMLHRPRNQHITRLCVLLSLRFQAHYEQALGVSHAGGGASPCLWT